MASQPFVHPLESVPDLVALGAARPQRYPFLLDSAAPGPLGRCSLLLRHTGELLQLEPGGLVRGCHGDGRFLERLEAWFRSAALPETTPELPFVGGWFVYLGYELAADIEPVLALPPAADGLPTALAARCDGAVLVRHGPKPSALLVAESRDTLAAMRAELARRGDCGDMAGPILREIEADPPAAFEAAVRRIQEYIIAGDVFQVNLSRAWRGRFSGAVDPAAIYARLRTANPAPFAGLMRWGGQALLSSSPERLVEVRGDRVQVRPIAGTHPRGHDAASDRLQAERMLAHPKERAEHIMLIDLERNDLGRVCRPGSVEVNELMVRETYAHVHHIVSNVRGRLRAGTSPVDVIRAVFPGGTITGCPKVRCMEIIAELEGTGRGFYTGSMGYIDRRGHLDLNILIRSMLVRGADFALRTGAGIVADSIPTREVAETEHKARGLLAAVGADAGLVARSA